MIFIIIGSFVNVNIVSSANTLLFVTPQIAYALSGESLTVDVAISDVERLHEWQVNLSFNPDVLRFINVTEGEFLLQGGRETTGLSYLDRIEDGWALFSWAILGKYAESGSGTLATVEFEVLVQGESPLDIATGMTDGVNMTHLIKMNPAPVPPGGQEMEDIPFTAIDGIFFNAEVPPTAIFTYFPETPLPEGTVTFNASLSYTTAPKEIIEYYWDFGDNVNDTGMIVEHVFAAGGAFNVTLTVIDDANATTLVQAMFGTTKMPRIWYELFSSTTTTVTVKVGHDIAVTNVRTSENEVSVGETVSINVTVRNKGIETEDFNVKVYYDDNLIETKPVTDLSPDAEETLVFDWDTTGVAEGDYQIWAEATDVEGEGNPQDNEFIDGTVTVKSGAPPFPTTLVIGAAVAVAAVAIVLIVFIRRRSSP